MRLGKPACPIGYVDHTDGQAYWWNCASDCPSADLFPRSDPACGCACVKPSECLASTATDSCVTFAEQIAAQQEQQQQSTTGMHSTTVENDRQSTEAMMAMTTSHQASESTTANPSTASASTTIQAQNAVNPAIPTSTAPAAFLAQGGFSLPASRPSSTTSTEAPTVSATSYRHSSSGSSARPGSGLSGTVGLVSMLATGLCFCCMCGLCLINCTPKNVPTDQQPLFVKWMRLGPLGQKQKISRVQPVSDSVFIHHKMDEAAPQPSPPQQARQVPTPSSPWSMQGRYTAWDVKKSDVGLEPPSEASTRSPSPSPSITSLESQHFATSAERQRPRRHTLGANVTGSSLESAGQTQAPTLLQNSISSTSNARHQMPASNSGSRSKKQAPSVRANQRARSTPPFAVSRLVSKHLQVPPALGHPLTPPNCHSRLIHLSPPSQNPVNL